MDVHTTVDVLAGQKRAGVKHTSNPSTLGTQQKLLEVVYDHTGAGTPTQALYKGSLHA